MGGNFGKRGTKRCQKHLKTRKPGRKLKFLASVCFRDHLAAAVSLVSELYPIDGVGKFGGRGGDFGKRDAGRRKKTPETRIPGRKLKFLASVCFRGPPSAPATAWPRWFRQFRIFIRQTVLVNWVGDFGKLESKRLQKRLQTRIPGRKVEFAASVFPRARLAAPVSLVSDIYPIDGVGKFGAMGGGFWKLETARLQKTPENADTGAEAQISSFRLLPWASVCFRGRLAAVISLVSDIYPLSGIGKLGGNFGKSET